MNHNAPPESSGSAAVAVADSPRLTSGLESSSGGGFTSDPDTPGSISWQDPPATEPVTLPDATQTEPTTEPGGAAEPIGDEPLATAAPSPEPPASPLWSLGPVGRRRSVPLLVVLSVVTLGVFVIVWFARANREMREFDPRMQVRPRRSALAVAVPIVATLLVAAAAGARIIAARQGHDVTLPLSSGATAWFLAAPVLAPWLALLLPCSLVAVTMTVERLRIVEDRAGMAPDLQARPVASLGWLLIPAVGIVVAAARAQARLNGVWPAALP